MSVICYEGFAFVFELFSCEVCRFAFCCLFFKFWVRGMRDEFQQGIKIRQAICNEVKIEVSRFGFEETQTPVLEKSDLFVQGIGADSEVVAKELFYVDEKKLALRPENTAGMVRALVENGYLLRLPVRWFYEGEMFRRERPQLGRYRQFRQFGVEMFCRKEDASKIAADLELILMANNVIKRLGLRNVKLSLNTLGDSESRKKYSEVLKQYLENYTSGLSADSIERLKRGSVLRILDSKDPSDQMVLRNAPLISESLNEKSSRYWLQLQSGLKNMGIDFVYDERLVRGLNYYEDAVFEFVCESELLGQTQGTILAGGRYDGLVRQLGGGVDVSGAGWSLGVDRIALLLQDQQPLQKIKPRVCVVTTLGVSDIHYAVRVVDAIGDLADSQLLVGTNFGRLTKKADQRNAGVVVFVGEDEMKHGNVKIKNMATGEERLSTIDGLPQSLEVNFDKKTV